MVVVCGRVLGSGSGSSVRLEISGGRGVNVLRPGGMSKPLPSEMVLVYGLLNPDGSIQETELYPLSQDFDLSLFDEMAKLCERQDFRAIFS
mmetsp:Transcript_7879/g.15838  ORF Transcript_7879/g.15838 Transcript_7879/m.15838 type:complete len:91 (+) Transcript_7879:2-274(+)